MDSLIKETCNQAIDDSSLQSSAIVFDYLDRLIIVLVANSVLLFLARLYGCMTVLQSDNIFIFTENKK